MKISSASPDPHVSYSASWLRPLWLALACGGVVLTLAVTYPTHEHRPPLRVGINAWPGYEFLYLAHVLGYFHDEAIEVQIVEFSHLIDSCRAFEKGHVDGIGGTLVELALARDRSARDPRVVFVADWSDGADLLVARSPVESVTDLRRKRVGVEVGSLGSFILAAALESVDLELSDVDIVPGDQVKIESLWNSKRIDAAVTYPPYSVRMLREPDARVAFSTAQIPREVTDVLFMDQAVLEERGDECRALLRGLARALEYYRENPDRAAEIMAKREGISAADFRGLLRQGIHLLSPDEQADMLVPSGVVERSYTRVERTLSAMGLIQAPVREPLVIWREASTFWSDR